MKKIRRIKIITTCRRTLRIQPLAIRVRCPVCEREVETPTVAQVAEALGINPQIIYAGTGEAPLGGTPYADAWLLNSTDGGRTWQLLEKPVHVSSYKKRLPAPGYQSALASSVTIHGTSP